MGVSSSESHDLTAFYEMLSASFGVLSQNTGFYPSLDRIIETMLGPLNLGPGGGSYNEPISRLHRTGHAHIGEYYCQFVPSENQMCHCSDTLQTRQHTLFECKTHYCHRHILGTGRTRNIEFLLGTEKGIRRLARFLKAS